MPFSPVNTHAASIMESKDRRAMHSDRQHALHATDRRKSKTARIPKSHGGSRPGSHITRTDLDDLDDYTDYASYPNYSLYERECPSCTADSNAYTAKYNPSRTEVSLAEVIQIKPGRKKKGPEGDFEMVPRPGEVLALDEDQDELNAEWEDVSGALRDTSNVARLPVSYAAALSRR